jgi:hypothetical protein
LQVQFDDLYSFSSLPDNPVASSGQVQGYAPACELLQTIIPSTPLVPHWAEVTCSVPRPPQTFPELHIAASVDSPAARDTQHSQPQWHSQHAQCSPPPLARLQWPPSPCWSRRSVACASPHPPLLDRKYGGDTLPIKRKDEQTRPPTVLERDWARRSLEVNSWCRAISYSSREALCGSLATTAAWYVYLKIEL